jgi:chromosome segregation ATPase
LVDLEETVRTREEEIVQLSDQLEDTKKELREKADAPVAVPAKDNTEELDSAKRQLLAQAKAIDDLESELKLVKARHEKKEKAVGELETELEDARKAYSELRRTKSRAANLTDDQPSQSDFERVSRTFFAYSKR